jgi:hypothetical protein
MPRGRWPRFRAQSRAAAGDASEPEGVDRTGPTFVVGDVHGCLDTVLGLLRDAALIDARGRWQGRDARLWFVGDLVDRGPDGVGTIELVQRLQREGDVHCLLGNHEPLLLAAHRFADVAAGAPGETFRRIWEVNGGVPRDLERLTPGHAAWLQSLPAIALEADTLLVHADSDMYLRYGDTVAAVNAAIGAVISGDDTGALFRFLGDATERHAFADPAAADRMLDAFGGGRIVHGHTPISLVLDSSPADVREPFVYAAGRCVNVDHGLFLGGPGFVTELSRLPAVDPAPAGA